MFNQGQFKGRKAFIDLKTSTRGRTGMLQPSLVSSYSVSYSNNNSSILIATHNSSDSQKRLLLPKPASKPANTFHVRTFVSRHSLSLTHSLFPSRTWTKFSAALASRHTACSKLRQPLPHTQILCITSLPCQIKYYSPSQQQKKKERNEKLQNKLLKVWEYRN